MVENTNNNFKELRVFRGINLNEDILYFPLEKPQERRSIIVLPLDEIYQLKNPPLSKSNILKPVTFVAENLSLYNRASPNTLKFLQGLDNIASFKTFPIFLQDEFDKDLYYDVQLINQIVKDKWSNFFKVSVLLGLKAYKIKISNVQKNIYAQNGFLGLFSDFISAGFSINTTSSKLRKEISSKNYLFKPQSPNVDKAREFINKNKISDDDINNLVFAAKNNNLKTVELNLNLFSQINNSLEIALKLDIPSACSQFGVSFKNKFSKTEKFDLELKAIYGKDELEQLTESEKKFLG